jgi:hypothetical protein
MLKVSSGRMGGRRQLPNLELPMQSLVRFLSSGWPDHFRSSSGKEQTFRSVDAVVNLTG